MHAEALQCKLIVHMQSLYINVFTEFCLTVSARDVLTEENPEKKRK